MNSNVPTLHSSVPQGASARARVDSPTTNMHAHLRIRFAIAMAGALAACEHTAPFRPGAYGASGPLNPGVVARLTFNLGQDLTPAWVPGTNAIVYTAERMDRADRDRCLAFMPGTGGAITRYVCGTSTPDESLNVYGETAVSSDGHIAYVRASNTRALFRIGPDAQQLDVGPLANPTDARVVHIVPLTTAWGRTYDAVSYLGWLSAHRLVMIGDSVRYPRSCGSCPADTVRTGIEIVTVDFADTGLGTLTLVPGTDSATSVTPGATGDTIYFTRAGDSGIHRYAFSTGQASVAFDFGPGRLVRDVTVASGRLVAIVDGRVADGGDLHVVNLATTADSIVAQPASGGPLWFARPALAPDGRQVVAQARVLTITAIFDPATGMLLRVDTTAAGGNDLWAVQLP